MVYKFFDEKIETWTKMSVNEVLAPELDKPAAKKFNKKKNLC